MKERIVWTAIAMSAIFMALLFSTQAEASPSIFPSNGGDVCFYADNGSRLTLSLLPAGETTYVVAGTSYLRAEPAPGSSGNLIGTVSGACNLVSTVYETYVLCQLNAIREVSPVEPLPVPPLGWQASLRISNLDTEYTSAELDFFPFNGEKYLALQSLPLNLMSCHAKVRPAN